jgi:hypothetical protein
MGGDVNLRTIAGWDGQLSRSWCGFLTSAAHGLSSFFASI